MKKTLFMLAILSPVAHADEGMWMPQQLPQVAKQLKTAGLALDPATLTKLTEFPMNAIVGLTGCSGAFVSPQGLVASNHHCIYGSIAANSTPERDLLAKGFLARTLAEELPAAPSARIFVTKEVSNVSDKVIGPDVANLRGKARSDAIERNGKALVAACEQDAGHRCTVASYYGGLEFYLIKRLEIRDVRLVHAPPSGVGKFGGDTDNWMWPRHTGDYGFYRAYVSPEGKGVAYHKDNVPYQSPSYLTVNSAGVKEGDFVMLLGYPGRTNRHRLPSEVAFTFDWLYPAFVAQSADSLATIARETRSDDAARLKYAPQVANINNYYKNRRGMLTSYAGGDLMARKTREHAALKAWIAGSSARKNEFGTHIEEVERLVAERDARTRKDFYVDGSTPRLLAIARRLYRQAQENTKPDAERKAGYQQRDQPAQQSFLDGIDRSYVEKVDKALVLNHLSKYSAQTKDQRDAGLDLALGLREGMSAADMGAALDKLYAGTRLADKAERNAWLGKKPDDFKASSDSFIRAAVAMYDADMANEAAAEALAGQIQYAYANYMKAKIAYMSSKGQAVYPDANSTLRVTFGKVAGRAYGADGTGPWKPFTTVNGVVAKATGEGDFNAPEPQLAAIRAKDFGRYTDPVLKTVPVNFLATLDVTGGNSGSATLNSKGEFVGLAFDGTLDSIISDWDYNKTSTRTIQVDVRYMLWNMEHVDKAHNLLKEMKIR